MSHTRRKHRPPAEHRAAAPHLFAGGRDHRLREPRAWSWRYEPHVGQPWQRSPDRGHWYTEADVVAADQRFERAEAVRAIQLPALVSVPAVSMARTVILLPEPE